MGTSNRVDYYFNKCREAKLISFDIFDTLIVRDIVDSDDIFLLANKASNTRTKSFDDAELEELVRLELSLCHPRKQMVELIRRLRGNGKTVVLTSDMYLKKELLLSVLEKVGIELKKDFDQVLVSCDYGCSKRDGGLYKKLKELYKVDFKDIVHFGDAFRSDYFIPKCLGMNAVWVGKETNNRIRFYRSRELNNLDRFVYNHTNSSYEYTIGYKCFGPFLYGFSLWLNEKIKCEKEVFFLAREGFIFQKALELMGVNHQGLKYLLISRRSITGALLWTYDDVKKMIYDLGIDRGIDFEKLASLLLLSGYTEEDGKAQKLKGRCFSNSDEIVDDQEAFSFISRHFDDIKAMSRIQYNAMEKYFESVGFKGAKDCVIVDIGWVGTMQHYLEKYSRINGDSKKVKGLYLGIHSNAYREEKKEGFLFDGDDISKQRNLFTFVGLMESAFSEQEGSVKCYCEKDGSINVERCNYEYDGKDKQKISVLQQGMLDFVRDMHNSEMKNILTFDPFLSSYNLLKFGNYPSKKELIFFKELSFCDDSYNLASEVGSKRLSLREFKDGFMNSIWKTAYLKCMFGIWFPAKAFYDFLYGFKKKR